MGKKGKYNGLHIDKQQLPIWINEFAVQKFSNSQVEEITQIKDTQHRCTIYGDGDEILIDFFFSKDGKTSMLPTGRNKESSNELAEFIYGKIQYKIDGNKTRNYSIERLERDIFEELLEYLNQLTGVIMLKDKRDDINTSDLYQYTSSIGDKITLIYYDKKKLLIQGKPLYLYNEVSAFLSAFVEFEEVIRNRQEFFDVEINPTKVKEEMQESLPSAYNILEDNLKKILAGSFALQKFDYPFDDYSPIAFPALKALEGYLKSILLPYGIIVKKTFAGVFKSEGPKQVLNDKLKDKIGSDVVVQSAEQIYSYLVRNRHTLFHTGAIDVETRILETRQDADLIVSDVLSLIENTHKDIQVVLK